MLVMPFETRDVSDIAVDESLIDALVPIVQTPEQLDCSAVVACLGASSAACPAGIASGRRPGQTGDTNQVVKADMGDWDPAATLAALSRSSNPAGLLAELGAVPGEPQPSMSGGGLPGSYSDLRIKFVDQVRHLPTPMRRLAPSYSEGAAVGPVLRRMIACPQTQQTSTLG